MAYIYPPDRGPIQYGESVHDSLSESYQSDTARAKRVFDVIPWTDRWDFVRYMRGYPTLVTINTFQTGNATLISNGLPNITVPNAAGWQVGMTLTDTLGYIPVNTTIASIAGNIVTMSANATGSSLVDNVSAVATSSGLTTQYVSRVIPQAYPNLTKQNGKPWLWFRHVESMKGLAVPNSHSINPYTGALLNVPSWNATTQSGQYVAARITGVYESLPYAILSDDAVRNNYTGFPDESSLQRYVTKLFQPTSEYLTFPRGAYLWNTTIAGRTGKAPVDGSNGRVITFLECTYVYHEVPGIPAACYTHIGCVNNALFDDGPIETMLLLGINLKPYRAITGTRVWDIEYKMRYFQPVLADQNGNPTVQTGLTGQLSGLNGWGGGGHNHFLRYPGADTNGPQRPFYDRITFDGNPNSTGVFPLADFSLLFKPPYINPLVDY